jgi:hypothetical protein
MITHRISLLFANALIASAVCACSNIGPATVQRDRMDYGSAIGESWKQQTLLNIVKLRYGDFPVFLEVAQVIANYQLESTFGVGVNAANITSGGPFAFGGSAAAQGKFTDRPTLIYAPLTGNEFLKKLMTPIPPAAVLFLLQSGYSAELILPITIDSINGVNNLARRGMSRPAEPQFIRLLELIRELQLTDAFQLRIEQQKGRSESTMIVFPRVEEPQIAPKVAEVKRILRLKPELREFEVSYGGYSGEGDAISMMTRSMLQIMLEIAAVIEVPASDVANGNAAPGAVDDELAQPQTSSSLKIVSGDAPPQGAYVAIPYNGHWFWIANTDIRSKYIFGLVMTLFSISDTGPRTAAPVVTVPAN